MTWDHNDWWWLASITLNSIWFAYAMLQARWARRQILNIKNNLFEAAPATYAWHLEKHFKKLRNDEGVMLMQSAQKILQVKKPVRKKDA